MVDQLIYQPHSICETLARSLNSTVAEQKEPRDRRCPTPTLMTTGRSQPLPPQWSRPTLLMTLRSSRDGGRCHRARRRNIVRRRNRRKYDGDDDAGDCLQSHFQPKFLF